MYILTDMATNIGSMLANEKLDRTNYDNWSSKVQFLKNSGNMVEFLIAFMCAPAKRDEHGNVVTPSEQSKKN